jgi:septal ring factor EnvC (AmiA/AmiB activator)
MSPKSTASANSKDSKVTKRTLNTLAARRYRQKRVDEMNTLESTLKETQAERDELKVRVARLEGELEALKGLLKR